MKASLLIIILFCTFQASGAEEPKMFDDLWENTTDSFTGDKTKYHLLGAALTPLIISTGLDAEVHDSFDDARNPIQYDPGVYLGYAAPFLIGLPLYIDGKWNSSHESLRGSFAIIQTTLITLTYISILKAFTGRPPPNNNGTESVREQSEDFNFGFLKRGIVDGWPSGHMGTTMALVSTLTHYYPERNWIKWVGYGTASYMFLIVSAQDKAQMHWFSDGVAGVLMGYAIGSTVGSNFREEQNKSAELEKQTMILPIIGPERRGIQMVWKF